MASPTKILTTRRTLRDQKLLKNRQKANRLGLKKNTTRTLLMRKTAEFKAAAVKKTEAKNAPTAKAAAKK